MKTLKIALLATTVAATATVAGAIGNSIPSVVITLQNAQPGRGVFLTPPWIGIHDGSFDSYDGGSPASVPLGGNEIESLAEDGNNGPLAATFGSLLPNAPQVGGVAGNTGPLAPGEKVSVTLNVNPMTDRFFSYATMIIPSNDAFIANGNPTAHQLFDNAGVFTGQPFTVSGDETNDAGTEVNDEIASNVAFLAQSAPNTGTAENGVVVSPSTGFAAPGVLSYPDGVLNYAAFANGDFNDPEDRIFNVWFRYVDLGAQVDFSAELRTSNELQADAVTSGAMGSSNMQSRNGDELRIIAGTQGLSGPLTAAHLHLGAAGTNGPVIVDLGAGIVGNGSAVRIRVGAADLTGPMMGGSFVDFLNQVAAGNVYLNLHTAQFPAGELRGQVQLAD